MQSYKEYVEPGCSPYKADQEQGNQFEMSNYSEGNDEQHDHGHGNEPLGEMSDKAKIRRDFGVEYEIPAMYILDAKFYSGST